MVAFCRQRQAQPLLWDSCREGRGEIRGRDNGGRGSTFGKAQLTMPQRQAALHRYAIVGVVSVIGLAFLVGKVDGRLDTLIVFLRHAILVAAKFVLKESHCPLWILHCVGGLLTVEFVRSGLQSPICELFLTLNFSESE